MVKRMDITEKQYLVLDYIKRFIAEKKYAPTVREIMTGLHLKSPSTVHEHLVKLSNAGVLTFDNKRARTIELLVENEYEKNTTTIVPYIDKDDYLTIPTILIEGCKEEDVFAYSSDKKIYLFTKEFRNTKLYIHKNGKKYSITEDSEDAFGYVVSKMEIF